MNLNLSYSMLQTGLVFRDSTGPCKTSQIGAAKLKFKLPLKLGNSIKLSKKGVWIVFIEVLRILWKCPGCAGMTRTVLSSRFA